MEGSIVLPALWRASAAFGLLALGVCDDALWPFPNNILLADTPVADLLPRLRLLPVGFRVRPCTSCRKGLAHHGIYSASLRQAAVTSAGLSMMLPWIFQCFVGSCIALSLPVWGVASVAASALSIIGFAFGDNFSSDATVHCAVAYRGW